MLGFPVHTRDRTSPRAFRWIWFIRLVQIFVTLAVLGITAANTATFDNSSCSVPGKLAWNLACAVIALVALAYFLLSTGPNTTFKLLPWWIFGQLALDAVLFVFWLSAAATARYNCNDLCNACGWDSVSFDGLDCVCYGTDYWYEKRGMSPKQSGLLQPRRAKSSATPAGTGAAKTALDALMTVLFFATLVGTIVYIFQHRSASSPTTHTPATGPGSHPEAGVQQVSTEMKQDIPYQPNNTNPQTQQGGYPPVSPQENYPPQGQYPPQQQGGYPPQQQYPQQGYPPQGQQQQQPMAYYGGPEVGQQPVQQQQPPMQQPPPIQQHQTAN